MGSSPSTIDPKEEMQKFHDLLRHAVETEIRVIAPDQRIHEFHVNDKEAFVARCLEWDGQANVYAGIQERRPGGTRKSDVTAVRVLQYDIDPQRNPGEAGTTEAQEETAVYAKAFADWLRQRYPHVNLIFSGAGWYVFLPLEQITVSDEHRDDVETRLKGFALSLTAQFPPPTGVKVDHVWDLPRIMRVPGTVNLKSGKRARFLSFDPEPNQGLRGQILTFETPKTALGTTGRGTPPSLDNLVQNDGKLALLLGGDLCGFPSRSEAEYSVVTRLASAGYTDTEIDIIMTKHCKQGKWQEAGPAYRSHTTKNARRDTASNRRTSDTPSPAAPKKHSEAPTAPDGYVNSDLGNAERFAARHGADYRYTEAGGWRHWDGKRWSPDTSGERFRALGDVLRGLYALATRITEEGDMRKKYVKWLMAQESTHKIEAILDLARYQPPIVALEENFDADHWLLNVDNGTLDLKHMVFRQHDPGDMITKLAPVAFNPFATAPTWKKFLAHIFNDDKALIDYIQRGLGWCLTGDTSDHILYFLYGTGANGKSTLLNTILRLMGDYAKRTAPDLLVARKHTVHPTERADLRGIRFAAAIEAERGAKFAEVLVKDLTGGDRQKARFLYKDFFEYDPTFKIWLSANHKPIVRGSDYAIWRRIKTIPFNITIPPEKQDHTLTAKLHAEAPGILCALLTGLQQWKCNGVQEPPAVTEATRAYQEDMDLLADFVAEECTTGDEATCLASDLYGRYETWAKSGGEEPLSQKRLAGLLQERGFQRKRSSAKWEKGRWRWIGIAPSFVGRGLDTIGTDGQNNQNFDDLGPNQGVNRGERW